MSKDKSSEVHIGEPIMKNSNSEKLLRIKIDSNFIFDCHVQDLFKKVNRRLRALTRASF